MFEGIITTIANMTEPHNPGMDFDAAWLEGVFIDLPAVQRRAATLGTRRTVKAQWQVGKNDIFYTWS